jgi:hypothetical protein
VIAPRVLAAIRRARRSWFSNRFASWLPVNALRRHVTPEQCDRFYQLLLETVSEATAEGYMMTLSSFFRWAVEVKAARLDNPIHKVEVIRAEHIARKQFCDKKTKERADRRRAWTMTCASSVLRIRCRTAPRRDQRGSSGLVRSARGIAARPTQHRQAPLARWRARMATEV